MQTSEKNMRRFFSGVMIFRLPLLLILLFFTFTCDAPRDNPLDPGSKYFTEQAKTTVLVKHLAETNPTGIANARVTLLNLGVSGQTDATGTITFSHPDADSLIVYTTATGYFGDTTVVHNPTKNSSVTIRLNARPRITSTKFISIYQANQYLPGGDVVSASIQAFIEDIDGLEDIECVELRNTKYNFLDTLSLTNPMSGEFSLKFQIQEIDSTILPGVLPELNFQLIVKNLSGDSIVSDGLVVRRVINQAVGMISPQEGEAVQDSVVFRWEKAELDFPFVYNLHYTLVQTSEQFAINDIPSDQTSVVVKNLQPGSYLWQVQIVDRLGNLSESSIVLFRYVQ